MTIPVAFFTPPPLMPRRFRLRLPVLPRRFRPITHPVTGYGTYHCPAPTSMLFTCNRPLPCTSHGIDTAWHAVAEYGHVMAPNLLLRTHP